MWINTNSTDQNKIINSVFKTSLSLFIRRGWRTFWGVKIILYLLNFPAALSALTTSGMRVCMCEKHQPETLKPVQFQHADTGQEDLQQSVEHQSNITGIAWSADHILDKTVFEFEENKIKFRVTEPCWEQDREDRSSGSELDLKQPLLRTKVCRNPL